MADTESVSGQLAEETTVLLTTFRRDGTPVNLAVEGDRAFFRTWSTAGKTKRIRNNPGVEVAPSTLRGKPAGSRYAFASVGFRKKIHATPVGTSPGSIP
ncbi:hypothetical protein [Rubrobacter indicoceani]|uniref:hypothetical protein n=1 Tax=Rubrobacter indicoceani TaxID=2051957 RepID=UPI001968E887|nr:hypothetical protein [Rubrobacter indicoceani]